MCADKIKVKVISVEQVAPMIREFTLAAVSNELYPFSPGAHVVVEMEDKNNIYRNAYSLLSDPLDTSAYKIAVRLQDKSRGGSIFMHEQVCVGDELLISPPSNLFSPHWNAKKHLLLAGGVGITPFMSYLPEMQRRGSQLELHYMFHSAQTGAYQDILKQKLGDKFFSYDSDLGKRLELKNLIDRQPLGTHIYICGPLSLIDGTKNIVEEMGIPLSMVHYEEFSAPKPGKPFLIVIKKSGQTVPVSSKQSMLEALESAKLPVSSLCRGGVCGQCACSVVEGDIEHRDSFLSADEKALGKVVMPCVSRAQSERLVLDI
jgi:ferredoxin-NADP reductase